MDVNPLFVDAAGDDLHLLHASPCRNAGDNNLVPEAFDVEYDPRIADGVVDIGADENHPHLYCSSNDFSPGGEATIKLVSRPNASPVAMLIGSGILEPPKPTAWGDFFLEYPLSLIDLRPVPSNGLISIHTNLPSLAAPFRIPLQAFMDGQLTNLCDIEVFRVNE